jgi:hypothetical protein
MRHQEGVKDLRGPNPKPKERSNEQVDCNTRIGRFHLRNTRLTRVETLRNFDLREMPVGPCRAQFLREGNLGLDVSSFGVR